MSELARSLVEYTSNYREGLRFADMAIKIKSRWVTPLRIKAMALVKMGNIDAAEKVIDKALQIKEFCEGYVEKGNIMKERGSWREAERYYRKALESDSQNVEAQMYLAHTLTYNLAGKRERFQEAEKSLNACLKKK